MGCAFVSVERVNLVVGDPEVCSLVVLESEVRVSDCY